MSSRHNWAPLNVPPFAGETSERHAARRAEIEAIVAAFRWGRFDATEAERMERRLARLRGR